MLLRLNDNGRRFKRPQVHRADHVKGLDNFAGLAVVILHQMKKGAPDKEFIPAPPEANCACNECPHMKKNTLEKVYLSLRDLEPRLEMNTALLRTARVPIDRMLALSA